MMAEGTKDIFLSCFKCGRIVRSRDGECPRCGLKFGPGTLFECPFCSGLIWRNATQCSACGIDLTEFSESVLRTSSGFDMDSFVDNIISTELEQLKSTIRRVACPGCGLMIRGDEEKCPRCDLPLEEAKVDCPVCGEKISISAKSCSGCQAVFEELPEMKPVLETLSEELPAVEAQSALDALLVEEPPPAIVPAKPRSRVRTTKKIRKIVKPVKKPVPKRAKPKKKPGPKRVASKPMKKSSKKSVKKKAPAKNVSKKPVKKKSAKKKPTKSKRR
ncbi:MAG: hypothetical protein KKE24_08520 [Candidatus Thermoplasmatota archaeon]|nr:hypothetical protein [Candidatus Thermoplasmatota archaeon]